MTDIGVGSDDAGTRVALQSDGKILLAGWGNVAGTYDFNLVRYNTDGTLDTTFNGTGKVMTPIGTTGSLSDFGLCLTVQADGKILVGGYSSNDSNNFTVVRFNTNGSLDGSFGTGGIVDINFAGSSDDRAYTISVQPDGKIILAGSSTISGSYEAALMRINSDGSLDTRLNLSDTLGGTVNYTENGTAVVLDSNVKIYDAELSAADNFNGATLTLVRNGGANAQDVFSATGTLGVLTHGGALVVGGTTIGTVTTNSGGTLMLTFNSNATNARVNSAMQQIAYSNSSDAPPASVQINWTFNDGNAGAQGSGGSLQATGSTTVTITAVNDAPVATITPATYAATEQVGLTLKNTGLSISDVDAGFRLDDGDAVGDRRHADRDGGWQRRGGHQLRHLVGDDHRHGDTNQQPAEHRCHQHGQLHRQHRRAQRQRNTDVAGQR